MRDACEMDDAWSALLQMHHHHGFCDGFDQDGGGRRQTAAAEQSVDLEKRESKSLIAHSKLAASLHCWSFAMRANCSVADTYRASMVMCVCTRERLCECY